ncbi:MAG: hypothetical protein GQ570_03645 [Helicobacteraceae bacterium]|nr:hypothetical protein [Helicobacteraceae bacterium]
MLSSGKWRETTIVGVYEGKVIFTTPFNANKHIDWHPNGVKSYEFRTIKSQADTEREEAIEEMCIGVLNDKSLNVRGDCETLYDAGYHNGVKVGEEVSREDLTLFIKSTVGLEYLQDELLAHFHIARKVK